MKQTLRIAVIAACPFPLARGTPIRILRLAEALAARGHDVHVLTYPLGDDTAAPTITTHRTRPLAGYRKLSPGPDLTKLLRLDPRLAGLTRRLHAAQPFDVLHAHHYEGILVGAAARLGRRIPLVYDAHTLLMNELPSFLPWVPAALSSRGSRVLDRLLPRLADHTVCVSQRIRDTLVDTLGFAARDVSVMANGIESEHFDPALQAGPVPGGRRVLFTGNLAAYQGIDHLLKSFAIARRDVPDAVLTIATDSSFAPYEDLAASLGIRPAIELLPSPRFADLPALICSAHVAVNPRVDCDGVPVKLLNYMAAARGVVSFAGSAPGVTHLENGWLAATGDHAQMAAGIVTLLRDPALAARLGAAARRYVEANSRWSSVAERCEELYLRLLGSR